jgi:hypothetical protein
MENRRSVVIVGRGFAGKSEARARAVGKSEARARAVGNTLKIRSTLLRRLAHFELLQDREQGHASGRVS